MYCYIYDSFLNHKKYAPLLTKIENRLIDLGINGKVEKLSVLKSISEVITDNIKSGVDTIVAVGNDQTFAKIINAVAFPNGITLGYIPVENCLYGKLLGIPLAEKACDVLSSRIIERIDLGKVNNCYFFSTLDIPASQQMILECNGGHFKISSVNQSNLIQICNLTYTLAKQKAGVKKICDPKDGFLEAVFTPTRSSIFGKNKLDFNHISVFPIRKIKIKSDKSIPLIADGKTVLKTPVTVEIVPKKLKIIVGKERLF